MQIPILIEPVENNGYRARSGAPFTEEAEGATSEEAAHRLRLQIEKRLRSGAHIVPLELGVPAHPWLAFAGMFDKDDPEIRAWKEIMAENRRQADADPSIP